MVTSAADRSGLPDPVPPSPLEADAGLLRPVPNWVGPLFLALGMITVPWVIYLGFTLPVRSEAAHYRGAWVGFDTALVAGLLGTGWLAYRGRDHVELPAVATATMLGVDAWFDVMTSSSRMAVASAVLLATCVELPLAALCGWIAVHAEDVRQQRLRLFRRRAEKISPEKIN